MRTSIVWFKTDLRLHDNETLVKAIEQSDEIIPVYCFDETHFKTTEFGFQKTGNFRTQFLLESLQDLDTNLRAIGSGLLIVRGKPEYELYKVAQKYNAQKLFAKKEVAYEEKQTEERVEKELWKLKCEIETFSTSTLYHAQDLPFSIKDIPDVFTNFRKRTEKESMIRAIFSAPLTIKSPAIPDLQLPRLEQLGLNPIQTDSRTAITFKGGETEAYQRLRYYFEQTKSISNYKETRNEMIGADYSSKFSAWLALGCLSPREKSDELIINSHNEELLYKWINSQTGNDFIDANMLELKLTGYMSNRGRQNVASYLCNDLKLDWRYGAAYFEQQLIDYDVCSNWGNWAYLAGVGNDPRGNRYFNIEKQANDYDSKKTYRNLWLTKI